MRTIAFVTQKGGAGKSTLASNISVAAENAGERVFIIDLDPLQSLVKWSKLRGQSEIAVEHIPASKLAKALEALEKKGVTLVVIDAPGEDCENLAAAIRAADLCVIPARPNVFDLWASEVTRAKVKEAGKEYIFLLNQIPPAQQSARVEQGAKALQAMGGLLAPMVSARVDYQEAARNGLGVAELHPSSVAAQEMRELWASVKRRLKKGATTAKAEAKQVGKVEAKAPAKAAIKAVAKAEPKAPAKVAASAEPKAAANAEPKALEPKAAASVEAKTVEPKAVDAKVVEPKAVEAKAAEPRAAADSTEPKPALAMAAKPAHKSSQKPARKAA
ncbi:MAG: ParA family protein [Methylocystis sp.]